LQKFVGIFQKVPEPIALRSKNFCGQLRRHLYAGDGRILRNVTDLIHLDAGLPSQRGLELFGE
jgi:hypothetical protein